MDPNHKNENYTTPPKVGAGLSGVENRDFRDLTVNRRYKENFLL